MAHFKLAASALAVVATLPLLSPVWMISASYLSPTSTAEAATPATTGRNVAETTGSRWCNLESDYAFLAGLKPGTVLNDPSTGSAILINTPHLVIGGNYHRNESAILDSMRFLERKAADSFAIASRRNPDYVTLCAAAFKPKENGEKGLSEKRLQDRILTGEQPQWLERLSPADSRLLVFAFRPELAE